MPFLNTADYVAFSDERMRKNNLFDDAQLTADVYCLRPGQTQRPHRHEGQAKFYYVITGQGEFLLGHETRTIGPGEMAFAPSGVGHGVLNRGPEDLVLLVAIAPSPNSPRGAEVLP